jgi:hypothetical protein
LYLLYARSEHGSFSVVRVVLAVIAVAIRLYVLGSLKYVHIYVSGALPVPSLHAFLILALIAIILAVAIRR